MALKPFLDEQLNYFKFASIVLNEFPKALRQTFRSMWDNTFGHLPGFQPWDDSMAVRNLFLGTEGGTTKVPTSLSYEEWDCTALFRATIYARSFVLPDSKGHHKTLSDGFVKPHKLTYGKFHASVMSPGGNRAETFALAIDQLRLLRNSLCHSTSSEIDKPTFDQYVQHAKDAFKALEVKIAPIDVIGGLTESDFPTKEVRKLEQAMKEETRVYIKFLEGVSPDIDELRALSTAIKGKMKSTARKEDITLLEQKINDLKQALAQDEPDTKSSLPKSCLPAMVPHFTGRQRECEEIAGHVPTQQHEQGDFSSAIESKKRALDITLKLYGEEHSKTADSYFSLGHTQHKQCDFSSALQSKQRALDIRLKLFGEDHSSTAHSYRSLAVTQHEKRDSTSAVQSAQRALDIRLKLFGEDHSRTADSYYVLGATQHGQGEFSSAVQSAQRALDIRLKLFGEEHSKTADSYNSLGVTQYAQGDFPSALQSTQRALDIRLKLFGEEHSKTADSYHSLGGTQLALRDFSSAMQSAKCVLDIRRKQFGEEHSRTADSYQSLGVAQLAGDSSSALQSTQRALDIRLKLFGEEHSRTADSYYVLAATQLKQGDFSTALQSTQRALDIRLKLFGEEHSETVESYDSLGIMHHALCDLTSALQSTQRSLDIKRKLFGEEHSSTADSYHSLGIVQQELGLSSALMSYQRARDIRRKLFGEERLTADIIHSFCIAQLVVQTRRVPRISLLPARKKERKKEERPRERGSKRARRDSTWKRK